MSQETEPPFTVGVTIKVFAANLGKSPRWVRDQVRARRIPTIPGIPGNPLIDPNYANRVLNFKMELEKTA